MKELKIGLLFTYMIVLCVMAYHEIGELEQALNIFSTIGTFIAGSAAAIAAWFSYSVAKENHASVLNKERAVLSIEIIKETKSENQELQHFVAMRLHNIGGSYAKILSLKVFHNESCYDLCDTESALELKKVLNFETGLDVGVLDISYGNWRLGAERSLDVLTAKTSDADKSAETHSLFHSMGNDISFQDMHGRIVK